MAGRRRVSLVSDGNRYIQPTSHSQFTPAHREDPRPILVRPLSMRILFAAHHPAPMKLVHFVHVAYARFVWLASFLQSPLLWIIRLYWGWQFFQGGKGKLGDLELFRGKFEEWGVPFPGVSVVLAATTECVGGLLLLGGLASRAAA